MTSTKPLTEWLLLVLTLPASSATPRMRIWRALKSLGCGGLRDGAYLLPANQTHETALRELAEDILREGGAAWLLDVRTRSEEESSLFFALFDRSNECNEFTAALSAARKALSTSTPQEITRLVRKLRRDHEALKAIDFFPNEASVQADIAWNDFSMTAETVLSPGEPHAGEGLIPKLDLRDYQARIWATRRHLWVDRVASAWLIRRFIDHEARFLWLASPADCPAGALGFDFDGAAFTHVGESVTFEVLLKSFGLENDRGLARLATMVHALDIGGATVPESTGLEAILSGMRQRLNDDDLLLREAAMVFDSLHAHFSEERKA